MTELLDSAVSALLVSDCRDPAPLHRLQRACRRVEELLRGIGFPETAKTLAGLREHCGEFPDEAPHIAAFPVRAEAAAESSIGLAQPGEDVLTGRRKRRAVGQ